MYRDNHEALEAQVRTLKAELDAERKLTAAARAAVKAARAAADEANLAARRKETGDPDHRSYKYLWFAIAIGVAALIAVGYMIYRVRSDRQLTAEWRLSAEKALAASETNRRLAARLKQELQEVKRSEERTAERLLQMRRSCQPSQYGQSGASPEGASSAEGHIAEPKVAKRDALDALIDGAIHSTLGRSQIQAGMRGIKGRVQGCYDRYKVPGLANVQVRIEQNGRVGSVRLKGMFAQTPTGACVTAVARTARFARFTGAPITITYPFILR